MSEREGQMFTRVIWIYIYFSDILTYIYSPPPQKTVTFWKCVNWNKISASSEGFAKQLQKRLSASSRLSPCPHGRTRLQPEGFAWDLFVRVFTKIYGCKIYVKPVSSDATHFMLFRSCWQIKKRSLAKHSITMLETHESTDDVRSDKEL
jgi:hypothetical protein